jgi:hypothetical protein
MVEGPADKTKGVVYLHVIAESLKTDRLARTKI